METKKNRQIIENDRKWRHNNIMLEKKREIKRNAKGLVKRNGGMSGKMLGNSGGTKEGQGGPRAPQKLFFLQPPPPDRKRKYFRQTPQNC